MDKAGVVVGVVDDMGEGLQCSNHILILRITQVGMWDLCFLSSRKVGSDTNNGGGVKTYGGLGFTGSTSTCMIPSSKKKMNKVAG
ncbi:hypothetical protein IFM89_003861 [Coptis chinensis]|uniref:Uncharacterized protein n=1 Tax=Coptis chinensis TaxID=261450 RepID=A0A835I023_9MAGN|nr:hypothetical protein IFM89_003861 [Coptis chinensis]